MDACYRTWHFLLLLLLLFLGRRCAWGKDVIGGKKINNRKKTKKQTNKKRDSNKNKQTTTKPQETNKQNKQETSICQNMTNRYISFIAGTANGEQKVDQSSMMRTKCKTNGMGGIYSIMRMLLSFLNLRFVWLQVAFLGNSCTLLLNTYFIG